MFDFYAPAELIKVEGNVTTIFARSEIKWFWSTLNIIVAVGFQIYDTEIRKRNMY